MSCLRRPPTLSPSTCWRPNCRRDTSARHNGAEGEAMSEEKAMGGRTFEVIATGSSAAMPPIPGLAAARPWTNREATTASKIPGRLLVLGGGVVGVEMAQAYTTLGSQVTLIEAEERLIAREEPFAGQQLPPG